METQRKEMAASIGLLILRIGIGGYLITHLMGKTSDAARGQRGQVR